MNSTHTYSLKLVLCLVLLAGMACTQLNPSPTESPADISVLPTLAATAAVTNVDVIEAAATSTLNPVAPEETEAVAEGTSILADTSSVSSTATAPVATLVNVTQVPTEEVITPQAVETPDATIEPAPHEPPAPIEFDPQLLDESRILYLGTSPDWNTYQLRVMDGNGENVRVLFEGEGVSDQDESLLLPALLDWSPDGRWVALNSEEHGLHVRRTDGSDQVAVLYELEEVYEPHAYWSPNSEQLAVLATDPAQIVIWSPQTGEQSVLDYPVSPQLLVESPPDMEAPPMIMNLGIVQNLAWSPDGTWFVLQMIGYREGDDIAKMGLYRYDLATNSFTILYEGSSFPSHMAETYFSKRQVLPIVSPDGTQILTDVGGHQQLLLLPASGGELVPIWNGRMHVESTPSWSPDGQWLTFAYNFDIYILRADGSSFSNVTNTPYQWERDPSWSPDGRHVIFSNNTVRGIHEIELYDMETQQIQRLSTDMGDLFELSDVAPEWQYLDSAVLAELDQLPLLELIPTPDLDQLGVPIVEIPDPPTPEPYHILEQPAQLMDPPWWQGRYLLRRAITLSSDVEIVVSDPAQSTPPLVQILVNVAEIEPFLSYPVKGYDVHVARWDRNEQRWYPVPTDYIGGQHETGVLTFALQTDLLAGVTADEYYMYYGIEGGRLDFWEAPLDIEHASLNRDQRLELGNYHQLAQGEEDIDNNIDMDLQTWSPGFAGWNVLNLLASEGVTLDSCISPDAGSISFLVRPMAAAGHLFTIDDNIFDYNYASPSNDPPASRPPFLTAIYRAQGLELTLDGQQYTFPTTLPVDEWSQLHITWFNGDHVKVYLNGELSAEAPFSYARQLKGEAYLDATLWQRDGLHIGSHMDQVGLQGLYANFYMLPNALSTEGVRSHYQGQMLVQGQLSNAPEAGIVTAEIGTEGGMIRSPDGMSWVQIAPNTLDRLTTVAVLQSDLGATPPPLQESLTIVPLPSLDSNTTDIDKLTQILGAVNNETPPFESGSLTLYHRYDPEYVEFAGMLITLGYSTLLENQVYYGEKHADMDQHIYIVEDIKHWGTLRIWKELGRNPERLR